MTTPLLLIEDDLQIRENVAELLTLKGYTVHTAADGKEGIMRATLRRPALILCDVMMPHVDGYQVLEAIRANRSLATVPFIFLTAKADRADRRRGMNLGADDYLTKPFTSIDLLAAIESRLDQEQRRAAVIQAQVEKHWNELNKVSAHEYNTPLTGIMGFAHLLMDYDESFDRAQVQSMLRMIITSCWRLKRTLDNTQLTNELLRTAPAVTPAVAPAQSRLSKTVVNQILMDTAGRYERVVNDQVDVTETKLFISEYYLHKVLEELIDNAIKFSPATSSIQIRGRQMAAAYQLTITNQGRGMTAENIASIAPYTQFGRNLHEQQGTGLGLFIAKRLIELANGYLLVSSQPDGPTTVTVNLPTVAQSLIQ